MGFVNSLFDSSKGAGFGGASAPILSPVSGQQTADAYSQSQQALQQQRDLLAQLQAQNGLGTQNQLAGQLLAQTQGQGPNPALAQLNQATGQNTANQAALMAGQRGAGANVGLLARQAAMQGSANEQNAIGQGASLQAQQQLNAQNSLGNLATQQAGQYIQGVGNLNQNVQNEQQALLNASAQQNNAAVGMQSNINQVNGQIAQGNQAFQQGVIGKVAGGAGSILGMASGGAVPAAGPASSFIQRISQQSNDLANQGPQASPGFVPGKSQNFQAGQEFGSLFGNALSKLAPNKSLVQGEVGKAGSSDLPMANMDNMAVAYSGGPVDYKAGGKLPGKADVKGDSLKNDKVPILGSPGEIMLPRSVTMAKDAPKKAAEFVAAILAKKNMGKK